MSSTRLQPHPSLPAPVVHVGFSVSQSKSHVLAGVQDAYWSDDEAEDVECPLCLEEMDISDLNFKPCVCGYQICRFCWHHIKENLNGRCPACRRVYTDEMVEFKPIAKEDHKRLTQQKKQRERERKELDALGRRQLTNVRVVQRNVVYVVGLGPRFAKEELIPTLRSTEYFGQYGKISKILLVKRTPSGGGAPVVGLYITYHRREDAARSIAAVDGAPSPSGGREAMRASYGTTKYCIGFLRGQSCGDHNCKSLHEWGDEKDCFTKEDLTTLKHTMKDTEIRRATKKGEETDSLPRTAAWGSKPATGASSQSYATNHLTSSSGARQPRRGTATRQQRSAPPNEPRPSGRTHQDRKSISNAKASSQGSSSRPSTPSSSYPKLEPLTDVKSFRPKDTSRRTMSPDSLLAPESDPGSGPPDSTPTSPLDAFHGVAPINSATSPRVLAVPPGLSAPSMLGSSRPPRVDSASPQTPLLASQSTYQMSSAARALLDEVKGRRETLASSVTTSPFPDLDRTLETLSGSDGQSGGFSFNLDPKLVGDSISSTEEFTDLGPEANSALHGNFADAFTTLRVSSQPSPVGLMGPPGLHYPHSPARSIYDPLSMRASPIERQSTGSSNYIGSFNPFAETNEDSSSWKPPHSPLDDDTGRRVSRFGFARGRHGNTATSSPMHIPSPLSSSDHHLSFLSATEVAPIPWSPVTRQDFAYPHSGSTVGSPLMQQTQAHAQAAYVQHQSRFQPFDNAVSEEPLGDLFHSSQERIGSSTLSAPSDGDSLQFQPAQASAQQFYDPAIMSARYASPIVPSAVPDGTYTQQPTLENAHFTYGPPPGLSFPPQTTVPVPNPAEQSQPSATLHVSSTSPSPPLALSSSDFPALVAEHSQSVAADDATSTDGKTQRKLAKKAAAAEKVAERLKASQEKAATKAAEKARITAEKTERKEKAASGQGQQESVQQERAQQDETRRGKVEQESQRQEKLPREKAQPEKPQRENIPQEKVEQERVENDRSTEEKAIAKRGKSETERVTQVEKDKEKGVDTKRGKQNSKTAHSAPAPKVSVVPTLPEPVPQVPLLSKKPKKVKPTTKPIRIPKEEDPVQEEAIILSPVPIHDPGPTVKAPATTTSSSVNSRAGSVERSSPFELASLEELFEEVDFQNLHMDLPNHPFFDIQKLNPSAKLPLEYGPLVHALSALSIGGGSFANNMPSGSIDNAVSSFQQLLETLTQTISDLLRLLPRTTWDDSSSFDGVLREMLKGDDFLDDGGDDGSAKEDEVAALTLALERRARWMEVQLSKLEELHRDINGAAVRAVLTFNDNGWDQDAYLPRVGNTLRRFDSIGTISDGKGGTRPMTADELEKKLAVAKEAANFAEMEVKELMKKMQAIRPVVVEF